MGDAMRRSKISRAVPVAVRVQPAALMGRRLTIWQRRRVQAQDTTELLADLGGRSDTGGQAPGHRVIELVPGMLHARHRARAPCQRGGKAVTFLSMNLARL